MRSFLDFITEAKLDTFKVKCKKTGKVFDAFEYTGFNQWDAIQFTKGSGAKLGRNKDDDSAIFLHGSDDGDEYTVNPGEIIVKLSKKDFVKVDFLGQEYVKHEELPFEMIHGKFNGKDAVAVQFTKKIDALDLYELFLKNTNAETDANPNKPSERAVIVTSGMFDDKTVAEYGDYLVKVDGMPRKVHVVKKEDFNKTFKH